MSRVMIFGFSKTGRDLAKELRVTGHDVVILDTDEKAHIQAVKSRYEAYYDTHLDDELLKTLGIGSSIEVLYCMSSSSANNLFVTLSSRHLSKNLKIISVVRSPNEEKRVLLAGANRTLNPYSIGAMSVLKLLQKPHLFEVLHDILFAKEGLMLREIVVPKGSFLEGKTLLEIDLERVKNVVLLGFLNIENKEETFVFEAQGLHHTIDEGEKIVVLGYEKDIANFTKSLQKGAKDE